MAAVSYSTPTNTNKMMFSDDPEALGQYEDTINDVKETINSTLPCVLLE